jgi:hypothetical protein
MERRFLANSRRIVGARFGKEKIIEKVDAAFGVVGGNDACGFSGLGPRGWSYTRE